ncbi:MAG: 3-oxoacyl-[acyl-carrier-protein] reductase [Armatimonadetes bacterium]|jgi:3-oxoacyl-[acyl-carrier protein] reductase|nr:3-oxoacyl-[acyl-carrier-protein] reductase [Armatimonadota bacterium]
MDLDGKIAVVTGAGGLIGRAIALTLAGDGADIVVNDVVEETARETAALVEGLGRKALVTVGSAAKAEDVESMVEQTLDRFGQLDIMINNAGITRDGLLVRMKDEQWDLVLDVNLKSAFLCTRAVARPMMKQKSGRIVNIASVVGVIGNAGQANYSASKGGLIALTKTTAKELSSRNIHCNAVAPGFIETPMTHQLSEEARSEWLKGIPLGRPGTAQDVADVVAFLCGPRSSYLTGQVISVCGGMVM